MNVNVCDQCKKQMATDMGFEIENLNLFRTSQMRKEYHFCGWTCMGRYANEKFTKEQHETGMY